MKHDTLKENYYTKADLHNNMANSNIVTKEKIRSKQFEHTTYQKRTNSKSGKVIGQGSKWHKSNDNKDNNKSLKLIKLGN
jgi:hypothetical protein